MGRIADRLPRFGPPLTLGLLTLPVAAGLAGTLAPAFGHFPAAGATGFSLSPWRALLAEPGVARSAWLSFSTGVPATLAALLISALLIASAPPRLLKTAAAIAGPLLAVPHAAAAFGLAFLIAPSGLLARIVSPELTGWTAPPDLWLANDPMGAGLMTGLALKEIPFLILVMLAALPQTQAGQARSLAASLGYGPVAGFAFTVWPSLYRQARLAVFAVLAFSTSVVDMAMILGPQTPPVLAERLLQWMQDPDPAFRMVAAAGALLQFGVTLAAFALWLVLERAGAALREHLCAAGRRFSRDAALRALALGLAALPALALAGGIAALALWSVAKGWPFPNAMPDALSLAGWRQALPRLAAPLGATLALGAASSLIAVTLAVLCLMREDETRASGRGLSARHALALLYLPLLVPQAAFLFGLQLLGVTFNLDGRFASVLVVHLVFVTPYVFLSLSDPWRALDRRHDAIAAALGHGRWRSFLHVRGPMLLSALLSALALGFAISCAQYLATVLVGAGRIPTITTEAVALASGGNRRIIGIFGIVQTALPAVAFLIASAVPAWLWRNRRGMAAG